MIVPIPRYTVCRFERLQFSKSKKNYISNFKTSIKVHWSINTRNTDRIWFYMFYIKTTDNERIE